MNRPVAVAAVVAVLIGALGGYLWWGVPTGRVQTELREARATADRLGQELDGLRTRSRQLEAQLAAEKARRADVEKDLRREKAIASRLHGLVSEGKK